jgi:hypothetical protein
VTVFAKARAVKVANPFKAPVTMMIFSYSICFVFKFEMQQNQDLKKG